jgi:hypothetical protein
MSPDPSELPASRAAPASHPDGDPMAAFARPTPSPASTAVPIAEEVDLWWGSYAGRTMTPSFLVCGLLTGLTTWAAWYFVPRAWVQLSALAAASVIWLVQLARWGARFFGWNYRLTTRRLFAVRGIRRLTVAAVDLADIAGVRVKRNWLERQLGVGRVIVERPDVRQPPLVLAGVCHPQRAADLIADAVRRHKAEGRRQ